MNEELENGVKALTGTETNAELQAMCDELGITVQAKNPKKPTKAELIASYENPIEDDGIPYLKDIPDDEVPGEVKDSNGVVMYKSTSKIQDVAEDNEAMIQVIVIDHDNTVQINNDDDNRLFSISWGNMYCESRTERFPLNKPHHVSKGAIKSLKSIKIAENYTDANGKPAIRRRDRFSVQEVAPLTQEQLDAKIEAQKGRS